MGEHMMDIDLFPVVVNGNNQAIFVSRDVEHGKLFHLVCRRERDPQFGERRIRIKIMLPAQNYLFKTVILA
jgi:hypothetical protein